jgi:predicted lysophospholipase L1 biosynthesis ABC-type transport system permease subunit
MATLVHAVLTSARRRTELAVLKAVGQVRSQAAATVVAHAATVTGVDLVVGLPVGLPAGRTAWRAIVTGIDVAPESPCRGRPWPGWRY